MAVLSDAGDAVDCTVVRAVQVEELIMVRHFCILTLLVVGWWFPGAFAATPGQPFTEDFSDENLNDTARTTANWSTEQQAVYLQWAHSHRLPHGGFTMATPFAGKWIAIYAVATGDVDGDGDLDMVTGHGTHIGDDGHNKLFLNDGDSDPFDGAGMGIDIGTTAEVTNGIALGDVDGDGDLDVVTANSNGMRLHLNDGDANPFDTAGDGSTFGYQIGCESVVLADMDGDGDLDAVAAR